MVKKAPARAVSWLLLLLLRVCHLQTSLFSLPLSVLPDWLVVLELFSAFMSCG